MKFPLLPWLMALFLTMGCQPNSTDPIRLGFSPWPGYELFFLAQELGFFKETSLPVQLVEFSSLGDSRRAYEQGLVDGIGTTLVEVAQIQSLSNRQPRVILVTDFSNGADLILARKPVTTLAELSGKRIGLEAATLGSYILHRALSRAGMDISRVTVVPANPLRMEQALQNGELDAAVTYPPFASRLLRNPDIGILFTSAAIPNEVVDVLVIDETILQRRRQDLEKLLDIWDKILEWRRLHPKDAHAIMARHEGIFPQELAQSMTTIRLLAVKDQPPFFTANGHLQQILSIIRQTLAQDSNTNFMNHLSPAVLHGDFVLQKLAAPATK